MKTNRFDDRCCFVCARPTIGIGVAPSARHKLGWLCDDPDCIPIGRGTYSMRQDEFTRIDRMASNAGGEVAGQYLDEIDKTDLAELTEEEWAEFLRKVVGGYRVALQTKLRDESPF
ncbi:MAG: DUF6511 domain-containing protein [Xanthobacteraceae bacterium]